MYNATATKVLIENGWNYLACSCCSKKVVGDDEGLWRSKFKTKIEMLISRFLLLLCFEVEDKTGSTIFIALDSEVPHMTS
ncbi:hypothetical protein MKW98_007717 [Papaver atlanticum]|uniref:Uncharacterized protein n=1 Tax=Papaver atlanticum TaxID=357466 RepID=A0AAD4S3V8_9MAGN|nr:hypothetical protein MKW98_007717 [Papaver atlanticum]